MTNQPDEQQTNNSPAPEAAEVEVEVEASEPQDESQDDSSDDGYDPKERVEITDPKVQRKFNDIYKQMKMSDTRNKMYWDMIQKQQEELDGLRSRFSQTDEAEAERIILSRLKEARENGEDDKIDKITKELVDFRVESKLKSLKPEKKQPEIDTNGTPMAQDLASWAQETDNSGNLVRPWMSADHPKHIDAAKLAGIYAQQAVASGETIDIIDIMSKVENDLSRKPQRQQSNSRMPDPLRGNLTNSTPRAKIKLSPQELAMANKLGISAAEYAKWK